MFRYTEERVEFAKKLHEPDDGCGTCGFWRDSLENCRKCGQVGYMSCHTQVTCHRSHTKYLVAFLILNTVGLNIWYCFGLSSARDLVGHYIK